jgi:hypothetical protein
MRELMATDGSADARDAVECKQAGDWHATCPVLVVHPRAAARS